MAETVLGSTTATPTTAPIATPTALFPERRPLEADHAPAISSPLNPLAASTAKAPSKPAPPVREQREKKESLKKREATGHANGNISDVKNKKLKGPSVPSPMRYSIPEPKPGDYEAPKDPVFMSHEPTPFYAPDGRLELKRPIDHAENKKAYRYTHCIADPLFRHKQYYRQSDSKPYGARMSVEDSDRAIHFDDSTTAITNEKGWRTSRANVCAREGSLYYEVKIVKGVPTDGPIIPAGQESVPQAHIRMGWARREAPLDAPVGFDGYSYGITDIRFETMHRSRSAKIVLPPTSKAKSKSKTKAAQPPPVHENDHVRTGDVVGLLINLPSLSLHKKVIEGIYNPAVDSSPGFDDPITAAPDIIRDRIPVPYRGNIYFEQFEFQTTKSMETYSDRGPFNKVQPHPNHEDVILRSLPHSSIKIYKNGRLIGTAFEKLLAFLPPASVVPASTGARVGFDDGALGYYPCVSSFSGGIAQTNFGPDFWFPPAELNLPLSQPTSTSTSTLPSPNNIKPATLQNPDTEMKHAPTESTSSTSNNNNNKLTNPKLSPSAIKLDNLLDPKRPRGICERFKEQVVEDIVWDIIDESDFFAQDGGYGFVPDEDGGKARGLGLPVVVAAGASAARGIGLRDGD